MPLLCLRAPSSWFKGLTSKCGFATLLIPLRAYALALVNWRLNLASLPSEDKSNFGLKFTRIFIKLALMPLRWGADDVCRPPGGS